MARSGSFKKNPSKPKSKRKASRASASGKSFYDTPFGKKILAAKARKNPGRKSAATKESTVSKPKKAKKAKKAGAKRRTKKATSVAAPKRRKRRTAKKTGAKRSKKRSVRVSKAQRAREIRMGNTVRRRKGRKGKRKVSAKVRKLTAHRNRMRAVAKKSKGASKSIASMRARAAGLKLRALRKSRKSRKTGKMTGLSPAARKQLKASGLMKVNPSLMGIIKDMGVLLPQAGMTIAGLAGAAILSSKIVAAARTRMPTNTLVGSVHAPAVVSALLGILGYVGARMAGGKPGALATFVNKLAPSLFIGGIGAAAVHTMAAVKVGAPGAQISLGAKLGLPIGEYVIGGMGEYVIGQGAMTRYIDVDGSRVAVDGQVGSIFNGRTIGEYVANEVTDDGPREGARGRRLEASAAHILRDELAMHDGKLPVDGNLSGSIFDD